MKSGREVGKVMGPLFPRLHVNDADKGGPRAPPRNKMALYEQFSIPSQRFDRSLVSMPQFLPSSSPYNMVPAASNSQENLPSQYKLSPQEPSSKELQSFPWKGKKSAISSLEFMKNSSDSQGLELSKDQDSEKFRLGCSSSLDFPKAKNTCQKKTDDGDEDDYSVPTLEIDKLGSPRSFHGKSTNAGSIASSSQTIHHSKDRENSLEEALITGSRCKRHGREDEWTVEEAPKVTPTINIVYTQNATESEVCSMELLNQGDMTSIVNAHEMLEMRNSHKSVGRSTFPDKLGASNCDLVASTAFAVSGSMDGVQSTTAEANRIVNHKVSSDNWKYVQAPQSHENGELENNDADSGSSIVVSTSAVATRISPDDTCRVLGPKNYRKVRQVLRNQQRVFTEQVFELHRLMKVQKLLAASPSVLFDENSGFAKPLKISDKSPSSNSKHAHVWQQLTQEAVSKDDQQKDGRGENTARLAPDATQEPHISKAQAVQAQKSEHCIRDPSTVTNATESSHSFPWCFPPPGNQWLIPVMSPSEGLIFKPCMAPYTPNLGFMAPAFGGFSSLPMLPFPGGAFPIPMPTQQHNVGHPPSFFMSPHGVPIANQGIPTAIERRDAPRHSSPGEQIEEYSPSSGNSSNPESVNFSGNKFHASSGHDLSAGAALSRAEQVGEHRQVIKVVPHNPRTASETTARIFQSIQKERLLHGLE